MGLRGFAGEMARGTAGLWKGVAEMVDPPGHSTPSAAEYTGPITAGPMSDASRPGDSGAGPADTDGVEELPGRMVVPIDTWSRILEQVGHVHEAGQQLAEARERAARAETENTFLREQLAELKKGRPRRKPAAPADSGRAESSDPAAGGVGGRIDRVRRRASGWLGP